MRAHDSSADSGQHADAQRGRCRRRARATGRSSTTSATSPAMASGRRQRSTSRRRPAVGDHGGQHEADQQLAGAGLGAVVRAVDAQRRTTGRANDTRASAPATMPRWRAGRRRAPRQQHGAEPDERGRTAPRSPGSRSGAPPTGRRTGRCRTSCWRRKCQLATCSQAATMSPPVVAENTVDVTRTIGDDGEHTHAAGSNRRPRRDQNGAARSAAAGDLVEDDRADDDPGDGEEQRDAEVAAREPAEAGVEDDDGGHGQAAEPVESGLVADPAAVVQADEVVAVSRPRARHAAPASGTCRWRCAAAGCRGTRCSPGSCAWRCGRRGTRAARRRRAWHPGAAR